EEAQLGAGARTVAAGQGLASALALQRHAQPSAGHPRLPFLMPQRRGWLGQVRPCRRVRRRCRSSRKAKPRAKARGFVANFATWFLPELVVQAGAPDVVLELNLAR